MYSIKEYIINVNNMSWKRIEETVLHELRKNYAAN